MKKEQFLESIDQLSDHYIEEALDVSLQKTHSSSKFSQQPRYHLPPKSITAVAMLCIGLLIIGIVHTGFSGHPIKMTTSPANSSDSAAGKKNIFSSLKVIAYAAETTDESSEEGTELENNVPVILSKYSPFMSSVPAMPFSFSYSKDSETDDIHFSISSDEMGILQKYDQNVYWTLTEENTTLECRPDEKIYWSPTENITDAINGRISSDEQQTDSDDTSTNQAETNSDRIPPDNHAPSFFDPDSLSAADLGADSIVTVRVYSGENLLETQYIGINYDDFYYTATLKLNVSTEHQYFGDVTVESHLYETTDHTTYESMERMQKKTREKMQSQEGNPENILIEEEESDSMEN